MATRRKNAVLGPLCTLFNVGSIAQMTDGQLLERFAAGGEAAELAFAALVERHGPVVLHVCRSILDREHDAEDAFQATFLVMVRKSKSLWVRDSLGPWLHQVAYRAARSARSAAARRTIHERRKAEMLRKRSDAADADEVPSEELGAAIHEEIERLPERYRVPILLCDLQGQTREQAARQLACPVGTIKSRLARGRRRLKDRLSRRGLTVASSALGAGWLTPATQAAPPAAWIESTVRTAMQVAASRSPVEVLPAAVLSIVKGVSRGLCLSNLRRALVATLTLGTLAAGATVLAWSGLQEPAGEPNQQPAPPATVAAPGAAKTGLQELKDEGSADLRGSWEVLYITGSASGKRAGHMLPGLAVTISDRTISLPSVTGKAEGPLRSLGEQAYTALPGLKEADEEVAAAEEQVRWHRITLRRLERAAREKQVPETALVRARKQIDFDEARLGNIQKKREARRAVTSAVESQIDIESPTEGGKVWQGIYWHRPGTLTICYDTSGRARPETFACNQPSECLIILRDGGAELHAVPQQIVPAGQHQQLSLRPARP